MVSDRQWPRAVKSEAMADCSQERRWQAAASWACSAQLGDIEERRRQTAAKRGDVSYVWVLYSSSG